MNPLLRSVHVLLFKQRMFSHSFISEGVKYNKELITNKYVYYIHTEKYSPKSYVVSFRTQISSSQSEERTMAFTREKNDIRPIRIANDVFSRVRKMIRPIIEATEVFEFRAKIPAFYCSLQRCFAHIQREKFYSKSFSP